MMHAPERARGSWDALHNCSWGKLFVVTVAKRERGEMHVAQSPLCTVNAAAMC